MASLVFLALATRPNRVDGNLEKKERMIGRKNEGTGNTDTHRASNPLLT